MTKKERLRRILQGDFAKRTKNLEKRCGVMLDFLALTDGLEKEIHIVNVIKVVCHAPVTALRKMWWWIKM